ncbi:MAG: hypothetical protein ACRDYE_09470 [Acidimicrobiales bacterium]
MGFDLVIVIGGLLVLALALATTAALYLGLLGAIGAIRLVRCSACGHWGWTSPGRPLRSCPFCRHGHLLHPILTVHHTRWARHHEVQHPT